ncbi:MAG: hypothetical protein ACRDU8_02375, partial [Egibacteraceae bacterium]
MRLRPAKAATPDVAPRAAVLRRGPVWVQRAVPLVVVLLVVPAALSISVVLTDQPIRPGQRSPRTVVAPDLIRVPDPDATSRAQREAADAVEPILVDDPQARADTVQDVRDAFAAVRDVRQPDTAGDHATREEQVAALADRLPSVPDEGLGRLVRMDETTLGGLAAETLSITQQLARQRITSDDLERVADQELGTELAVRSLPQPVAEQVVAPIVRDALRPTVLLDEQATLQARSQAAQN